MFFSSTCLASYFRFREEAVKKSGNPNVLRKTPSEIENRMYLKAETKVCAHSLIVSLCKERFQYYLQYCLDFVILFHSKTCIFSIKDRLLNLMTPYFLF